MSNLPSSLVPLPELPSGRWLTGIGMLVLVACSPLEPGPGACNDCPGPSLCQASTTNPVALDDATLFGTPNDTYASVIARSGWSPNVRYYLNDGTASYELTTADVKFEGAPASAMYGAEGDCPPTLELDGASLRFKSVDGAFDEAVSGKLVLIGSISSPSIVNSESFSASPTEFAGSYDLARVTQQFEDARVSFTMSVSSYWAVDGAIDVHEAGAAGKSPPVHIASWGGGSGLAGGGPGGGGNNGGAPAADGPSGGGGESGNP